MIRNASAAALVLTAGLAVSCAQRSNRATSVQSDPQRAMPASEASSPAPAADCSATGLSGSLTAPDSGGETIEQDGARADSGPPDSPAIIFDPRQWLSAHGVTAPADLGKLDCRSSVVLPAAGQDALLCFETKYEDVKFAAPPYGWDYLVYFTSLRVATQGRLKTVLNVPYRVGSPVVPHSYIVFDACLDSRAETLIVADAVVDSSAPPTRTGPKHSAGNCPEAYRLLSSDAPGYKTGAALFRRVCAARGKYVWRAGQFVRPSGPTRPEVLYRPSDLGTNCTMLERPGW